MTTTLFVPDALEKRNALLFEKLVPSSGKSGTVEGETLRAINKILYRFYNDGDYWYKGYGIETAGSAEMYLRKYCPVHIIPELDRSDGAKENDYVKPLHEALEKIITHIEGCESYTSTDYDMLEQSTKYDAQYEDDMYDDEEDWEDEE